jgi:hypothetical protein
MAAQEDPAEQPDAPRPGGEPVSPDETAPLAPVDRAGPSPELPNPPTAAPSTDVTAESPAPFERAPTLPAAPATPPRPPDATTVEPPRWAARARVPTPKAEDDYADQWAVEQPRTALLPVLLTVVIMLLLGVFGVGIWLLLSNQPAPNAPAPPPAATTTATTQATTPGTTTTTASPTESAVAVPDVVGKDYADAAVALVGAGLKPDRHDQFSDTVPAGTVIAVDPPKDTPVAPGTVITVFVSEGPQPTPTATASPSAPVSPVGSPPPGGTGH